MASDVFWLVDLKAKILPPEGKKGQTAGQQLGPPAESFEDGALSFLQSVLGEPSQPKKRSQSALLRPPAKTNPQRTRPSRGIFGQLQGLAGEPCRQPGRRGAPSGAHGQTGLPSDPPRKSNSLLGKYGNPTTKHYLKLRGWLGAHQG